MPAQDVDQRAAAFQVPAPRDGGWMGRLAVTVTTVAAWIVWLPAFATWGVETLPSPAVAILAFLPFLAVALLVWAFLLWLLAPDLPAAAWLVAALVLAPLAWWGPSWAARPTALSGEPLRVMTWNVRRLWGAPEGSDRPVECVIDAISAETPDVLVLQEVTRADVEALTTALDLTCAFGTYRIADDARSSGLAVCSLGGAWHLGQGAPEPYDNAEDWRFIGAQVSRDGRVIDIVGVHFRPFRLLADPIGRLASVTERLPEIIASHGAETSALLTRVAGAEHPVVVAGDFNSPRDTPVHARLRSRFVDAWERGATGFVGTVRVLGWLPMRIDYVYVSPDLGVQRTWVPESGCSDHRAVVTDLLVP